MSIPKKKRIVLIAATTGYQTRTFAEAGERLGYEIQLATDRCHVLDDPWGDQALPLRFARPEAAALLIERAAKETGGFDGVVAVGDRPAHIAALTAERLGLPHNPPLSVQICRNKYLARERFREAGLQVPGFVRLPVDGGTAAANAIRYPCVLKPLGLSASRGVIRADNPLQFASAFERIRHILSAPDIVRMREDQDGFIQVEDYIEGFEFALEAILTRGELRPIALFDKPDDMSGPFFEESIYVTPSRLPAGTQQAIIDTTREATAALGLTHGPVHAEMRVNDRGVWMLEVAARPIGGLCAQALKFRSGLGLEEIVLRHAVQEDVGTLELADPARGVMMIPIPRGGVFTGVTGVDDARGLPGIEDVVMTAKQGQRLIPLPEGASYLGFIFAGGDSPPQVEAALRAAHARLHFEILEALPVL